jgi:hypothetical protein
MKMWEFGALEAIMTLATAVRPFRIGSSPENIDDRSAAGETLREMVELLRDARPSMLVSGITVAAVTVGVAVEAIAVPINLHAGVGTVICLGLLAVLVLSVIRTAALMGLAGRPLMDQLGELRRQTGAPVDPTVPWTPVRILPLASPMAVWDRAQHVLAAAHFRNARIHLALGWATVAMIGFCAWSLALLITAGRI